MYCHPTKFCQFCFCISKATMMWGIGMASENQPGQADNTQNTTFDQVSDEGDGPPQDEACQVANALARQDERPENNANGEDEEDESKINNYYTFSSLC